jgi:cytochrome b involved in lipid metabolism
LLSALNEVASSRFEKMENFSVSFKPPSFRSKPAKSTDEWLKSKKVDDNADGLWRVHDKLYDLINFVNRHPGGADWLNLTQGTDITELFESHHISGKADLLLHSFYICEAKKPRSYRVTFCDDGFYKTLKKKIADQLRSLNRDAIERSKVNIVVTDMI